MTNDLRKDVDLISEGQDPALEKHYSVQQVADLWGLSANTVRRIFRDMPGVLKVSIPRLVRKQRKDGPHVLLRIPESLMRRAHQEWSRTPGDMRLARNKRRRDDDE